MLLKYMKQYIEKLFQSLIAMALLITAVLSICIFSSASILDEIQNMEDVQIEEEPDDSVVVMELNRPRDLLLEQQLKEYVEQYRYSGQDIAYCIQDMDNHEIYAYNADQDFFAASIYKLSLAMLYEDMIAEGIYERESLLYFDYSMIEDYGHLLSVYSPGSYVPLDDILDILIRYSDNSAGHILFDHLGGWLSYKQMMRGYTDVECEEWYTYDNITCAHVVSDVLACLYENADRYQHLIEVMTEATVGMFLDGNIQIGMPQKYGSYDVICNAAGFVEADIPYTIVVLTSFGYNGQQIKADLNEIVYQRMCEDVLQQ